MRSSHFATLFSIIVAAGLGSLRADPLSVPDLSVQGANGWNVTAGSVDVAAWGSFGFTPPVNDTVVDLDGFSVGQYSTTIDLPYAGDVTVNFYLGANFDGPPDPKLMDVSLGSLTSPTFSAPDNSTTWQYESYTFDNVAAGDQLLSFTSLDGALGSSSYYGPVISDVSASIEVPSNGVPDAGSSLALALLGLGMLLGIRRSAAFAR